MTTESLQGVSEEMVEKRKGITLVDGGVLELSAQASDLRFSSRGENETNQELQERREASLNSLFEALCANKERFLYMFKTEKGSWYFVDRNGFSLRYKQHEDGKHSFEPPLGKIIFVTPTVRDEILEIIRRPFGQEEIVDHRIQKIPFTIGAVPIEFCLLHMLSLFKYEETEDIFVIKGMQYSYGLEPVFADGIHVGHAIVQVL